MGFWKYSPNYESAKATRSGDAAHTRAPSSMPRRSDTFAEYLGRQPPERRAQLIAAEQEYVQRRAPQLAALDEVAYQQMCGLEDRAAGHTQMFSGHGDWSWQPQRHKPDTGWIFSPTEVAMLNDGWVVEESAERREYLETLMPTYRPSQHPLRGIRPGA